MLKRYRLAALAGLFALCVLTLDVHAAPSWGPLQREPAFELVQIPSRELDSLPGRGPYCWDRCAKRRALCLLQAQHHGTAKGPCSRFYRYCMERCPPRPPSQPPGGPPLYPPPGLRR
jgi:hypothetical protein